jgi:D-psicose/D-tagatose/L-ribulose 3-epimerase
MHLSSHTWMRPEPLEKTLDRISRLGYTSVELAGEPDQYPIPETRRLLEKYNIRCWGTVTIQHGTRDLTASDPQQRRDTIQYMKDVVSMAAELGGEIVTIVPGRVGKIVPTSTPENEWRWVVEGLREIAAFAKERNLRLGLEALNRFETHFLNRVDQTLALADEVGFNCGVAFDPFHMAIEEKDLYEAMRTCGSRIVDFHVSDNNRHAAGDGSFDWPKIMSVLAEVGYDGGLAVEFMPPIDRTPVGNFGANQLESEPLDVPADQLQFIIDHGSGVISDRYYTELLTQSAETLRPYLA